MGVMCSIDLSLTGLLKSALELWMVFVESAWSLISKSPSTLASDAWILLRDNIWVFFKQVGSGLIPVCFLAGWLQESWDLKNDFDWQKMMLMFGRILVIEAVYSQTFTIISTFLTGVASTVSALSTGNDGESLFDLTTLKENTVATLPDVSGFSWAAIVGWLLALLSFIVALVSGIMIFYTVVARCFKIFVLIPIGALPLATIAGGKNMTRSAVAWLKEFLICSCEVLVIAVSLVIGVKFVSSGFISNALTTSSEDEFTQMIFAMLSVVFSLGIVAAFVKQADSFLRKVIV